MDVKSPGSTWELHPKLIHLSTIEGGRIHSVAVECVDIVKNTNGEGSLLDLY